MVRAKPLKLGTSLLWKKKDHEIPQLIQVKEEAYYVLFLENLTNLLKNKEVRENVSRNEKKMMVSFAQFWMVPTIGKTTFFIK